MSVEQEKEERHSKEVLKGIGLTALLHLICAAVSFVFPFAIFTIGVVQLAYIIPATLIYWQKGRIGIVQGLLIGAGVTFLLNAACFGYVISVIG